MNKLINELYPVEKKDFEKTGHVFGRAFKDDPAFCNIFKNIEDYRRDAFFEGPARYCNTYGKVYATSPEIEGLAAWVSSDYADMTFIRIVRSGLVKSTRRIGMKTMFSMRPIFEPLEKARRRHMKGIKYIYLMTLGVDPEFQGKGFGSKLITALIEDSTNEVLPVYLETANEKNVGMYKKFGFRVLEKVDLPVINISQWCMIRAYIES
ncbi:MAG: GNAT family N-acetyltransferase [Spirochaetaceae bacterium]|nr:GNAT family N-acetyltransferase [Spirochaetaceae bacterium]